MGEARNLEKDFSTLETEKYNCVLFFLLFVAGTVNSRECRYCTTGQHIKNSNVMVTDELNFSSVLNQILFIYLFLISFSIHKYKAAYSEFKRN